MTDFKDLIKGLNNWGFIDVLFPFLLVFAIVFAVMEKTKIFGEDKKNIHVMIALIIGLSVVVPHIIMGTSNPGDARLTNGLPDAVEMINISLPQIGIIAVAFVMLLILVGIYGSQWMGNSLAGWMALISAIAVIVIFGGAAGWWESIEWLYDFFGDEALSVFIMLLVTGLIIWFITKDEKSQGGKVVDTLKNIGDYFSGK